MPISLTGLILSQFWPDHYGKAPGLDNDSDATKPNNPFESYRAGNRPAGAVSGAGPSITHASAPLPDAARLQRNAQLIDRTRGEFKVLADRIRRDRNLLSQFRKSDGLETTVAMMAFVVARTKQSGLYAELQQAALQRLKDAGSYEDLIDQILTKEQAQGRTRDRAWAEAWIERQYDFDCIDGDYKPGAPFMAPADGELAIPGNGHNAGSAVFYGDSWYVQARGAAPVPGTANVPQRVAITFIEYENELFYSVIDRLSGARSEPIPYDPRGTIIKGDGLHAEVIGTPAPGDTLYPRESRSARANRHGIDYLDPSTMDAYDKALRKTQLFFGLFDPIISSVVTDAPSDVLFSAIEPLIANLPDAR